MITQVSHVAVGVLKGGKVKILLEIERQRIAFPVRKGVESFSVLELNRHPFHWIGYYKGL